VLYATVVATTDDLVAMYENRTDWDNRLRSVPVGPLETPCHCRWGAAGWEAMLRVEPRLNITASGPAEEVFSPRWLQSR
jgi:hypothetical protein